MCVTSYNSTGFGLAAQNHMQTLQLFSDILCIQEHFLLDGKDKNHSNTDSLRKLLGSQFDMFIVPAVKENNNITRGRGKGGLAMLWKKGLTKYVSKVKTVSYRLQAAKFVFPTQTLIVINSYFPCDPRSETFDDSELLSVIAEIRSIILSSDTDFILLVGDLNADFSRETLFTRTIEDNLDELNLKLVWKNHDESQ